MSTDRHAHNLVLSSAERFEGDNHVGYRRRAPKTRPEDFLAIDALLADEERDDPRHRPRRSCATGRCRTSATGSRRRTIPRELAPELGKLGVLGMHLEGYGCAGASATAYGLACMELEAGDSGVRRLVSVQGSLAMFAIWRWGSEEQKQEWLPRMAAGEAIGCFGLTEPDAGSDPGSMRTRARRDGDDWILHGAEDVDHQRLDRRRRGRVGADRRGRPRLPRPRRHAGLHHRRTSTRSCRCARRSPPSCCSTTCACPAGALLPEATSLRGPLSCLNEARYGIVWGAAGAARACFEAALDYARSGSSSTSRSRRFQIQQQKLATMALEVNRATLLALHLGRMKDAGTLRPEHVSMGKLGNVNAALDVARTARQVLGANGITLEYPVIRHMNNLESVVTYEGTADVHALVIGGALTGIQAFR